MSKMRKIDDLVGQWIGRIGETKKGYVTLNFDSHTADSGHVLYVPEQKDVPCIIASVKINGAKSVRQLGAPLQNFILFNPKKTQCIENMDVMKQEYPNFNFVNKGQFSAKIEKNKIIADFKIDPDIKIKQVSLTRRKSINSNITGKHMSWREFKEEIVKLGYDRNIRIYRGQDNKKKLKTSLHRTGRNDLIRYCQEEMDELKHYINAVSSYEYNLQERKDVGTLLSLAQHYGFPTPFLDWTESPYLAAYFAYKDVPFSRKQGTVRIYVFERKEWEKKHNRIFDLHDPRPGVTVRIPAVKSGHERAFPQQSIFTFSNVEDIEGFIKSSEREEINKRKKRKKECYLWCIDLPISERKIVMQELRSMNIHAGTLFPGMEGICKSLKEKYFSD